MKLLLYLDALGSNARRRDSNRSRGRFRVALLAGAGAGPAVMTNVGADNTAMLRK